MNKQFDIESLITENRTSAYDSLKLKPIYDAFDETKPIMVSVVCNCYNHGEHIRRCLDGFMMQRVDFNVELLIHDDASTDQSPQIIKEYEQRYPNVVKPIYQQENQYSRHISITFRFQYPRSQGKYIAFCEGDDYWFDPYKLYIQVHFMEEHPDYLGCTHDTIIYDCRKQDFFRKYGDYGMDTDIPAADAITWGPTHKAHLSSWLIDSKYIFCSKPRYVSSYKGVGDQPLLTFFTLTGKVRFLNLTMSTYNMFSCATSWRVRNTTNKAANIALINRRIHFFEVLRDEAPPQYHEFISDLISKDRLSIAMISGDYRTIYSKENKKAYKALSIKTKFRIFLKRIKDSVTSCDRSETNHQQ